MESFDNPDVERVFAEYPEDLKSKLLTLRRLILDTASETEGVGPLEETLKWGQPSYLTSQTTSGTTIRIDQIRSGQEPARQYGMFVHCQTSLISTYRERYSGVLNFDGNRGITFDLDGVLPLEALRNCIELALTYHRSKALSA